MQHEKICKIHDELTQGNIIVEPNKSAKRGYTLRCRLCKIEKDRKWKDNNREQHNQSATKKRNEDRKLFKAGVIENEPKANTWEREDRKRNPEKYKRYEENYIKKHGRIRIRKMEVARIHGLTIEKYDAMVEEQNHRCKICNCEESRRGVSGEIAQLCIDHCHESGKIRALLCHGCNTGIGKFKDSIELLQSATRYLEQYQHIE